MSKLDDARATREGIETALQALLAEATVFVSQWFEAVDAQRPAIEAARALAIGVLQGRVALLAEATRREVLADLGAHHAEVAELMQRQMETRAQLGPIGLKLNARRGERDAVRQQLRYANPGIAPDALTSPALEEVRAQGAQLETEAAPLEGALAPIEQHLATIAQTIKTRYGETVVLRPGVWDNQLGNAGWQEGVAARAAQEVRQRARADLVAAGLA